MLVTALVVATILGVSTVQLIPLTTTIHQAGAPSTTRNSAPEVQTTWSKAYGGISWDEATSIRQTPDGGYIVGGLTFSFGHGESDFWLLKTNSTGDMQWNRTFGGADFEKAFSVQVTSDGGYIVAGYTYSFGAGYGDVWLVKTNSTGSQQWNRTYGGTNTDWGCSVQQTSDSGYIVAGLTYSFGHGNSDIWLLKTDSAGHQQWSRTFGGTSLDEAYSVQQTSDGGYILAGTTYSFGAGLGDLWIVKTDSTGNLQWSRTYGRASYDWGDSVEETSDGGYIMAGFTSSFGAGDEDFLLVKTNSTGSQEWNKTYGGTKTDRAYSVQETSDGGYVVAGWTGSLVNATEDFWLVKTDSSGTQQWNKTYGGISSDEAYSVQQTKDGGYILAGYTWSFAHGYDDFWLVKTDSSGGVEQNNFQFLFPPVLITVLVICLTLVSVGLVRRRSRAGYLLPETEGIGINERGGTLTVITQTAIGRCMVCNLDILESDLIVRCPYCGSMAHRTHMLEWLHVKDYCPACHNHLEEENLLGKEEKPG
jgi:uncharacterized delta-60 repeat protein